MLVVGGNACFFFLAGDDGGAELSMSTSDEDGDKGRLRESFPLEVDELAAFVVASGLSEPEIVLRRACFVRGGSSCRTTPISGSDRAMDEFSREDNGEEDLARLFHWLRPPRPCPSP